MKFANSYANMKYLSNKILSCIRHRRSIFITNCLHVSDLMQLQHIRLDNKKETKQKSVSNTTISYSISVERRIIDGSVLILIFILSVRLKLHISFVEEIHTGHYTHGIS